MTQSTLLDPEKKHIAHENVCLLELGSKEALDSLIVEPSIRPIIWTRLDETRALVDPTGVHDLLQRLEKLNVRGRFRDALTPEDE